MFFLFRTILGKDRSLFGVNLGISMGFTYLSSPLGHHCQQLFFLNLYPLSGLAIFLSVTLTTYSCWLGLFMMLFSTIWTSGVLYFGYVIFTIRTGGSLWLLSPILDFFLRVLVLWEGKDMVGYSTWQFSHHISIMVS
jgi:hypothetical protein